MKASHPHPVKHGASWRTKSQIQALDRTAPIFPMMPGAPARATHDYKRAGTSSLYAALDIASGKVIGSLHARHRAIEFKKFLQKIDTEVPAEYAVHVVLDNASTHKTPTVKRWLAAHPRFVLHFTPTSSSWLNLVVRHEVARDAVVYVEGGSADVEDVAPGPVRKDRPRLGVRRG